MTPDELEERCKRFTLDVVSLVDTLPNSMSAKHFGGQLLRCSSSVAANYRASRRGRSRKEFLSKLSIVAEGADEAVFWLEMMGRASIGDLENVRQLYREADELMRIFAAQRRTARSGQAKSEREAS
ncbi:MAG: four helix bundle protein [Planctomycetota bacterium]